MCLAIFFSCLARWRAGDKDLTKKMKGEKDGGRKKHFWEKEENKFVRHEVEVEVLLSLSLSDFLCHFDENFLLIRTYFFPPLFLSPYFFLSFSLYFCLSHPLFGQRRRRGTLQKITNRRRNTKREWWRGERNKCECHARFEDGEREIYFVTFFFMFLFSLSSFSFTLFLLFCSLLSLQIFSTTITWVLFSCDFFFRTRNQNLVKFRFSLVTFSLSFSQSFLPWHKSFMVSFLFYSQSIKRESGMKMVEKKEREREERKKERKGWNESEKKRMETRNA